MHCFRHLNDSKNKRFFMMHTSAMVPPCGPASTSRAFPQRIAGTLVAQEHAPTETSRPLSTGPDPCGRLQSFGPPVLCCASHWVLGPRCSATHTHPAVTVAGPFWHSVCDGLRVFLVRQYFRIVVIMRLRILATSAIDPLRNYTPLHQPAKPHRHKQRPITHHHGHGPLKCVFLLALTRHTHPSRGPPFAQSP